MWRISFHWWKQLFASISAGAERVTVTVVIANCQVNVAVCVDGGDTALITFIGVGFDKRLMGGTMKVGDASHLNGVPSERRLDIAGQVPSCDE